MRDADSYLAPTPKIYLVTRPQIDYEAVAAYLDDRPGSVAGSDDWEYTCETAAEGAIEFAARSCYDSFGTKQGRKDSGEYLRNILEHQHGCYDEETEVLTEHGWKRWPEVTPGDRLATRRMDGVLEYHEPLRLVNYHHIGRMYRVEAQGVDLLVTPDHKMLACPTTTKDGRKREDFRLIPATDLNDTSHAYVKTAQWTLDTGRYNLPLAVFRLLGFAIGDGYIRSAGVVEFNLRRERKIEWLSTVIAELGWSARTNGAVSVAIPVAYRSLFQDIYERGLSGGEKQIPPFLLTNCGVDKLSALLEGLLEADGHHGRTGDSFDTTSSRLAGQIQQLCLHLGIAANICYVYGPERRPASYGNKPLTRLSIIRRSLKPEVNKYAGYDGRAYWVEDWEGDVYCAEVPNHTLYVRRNGIPVWSGNSVLEHAVYGFMITGISRSLSLEFVRHRAGWAYSQQSQRFVDESSAQFVLPPLLEEMLETGDYPDLEESWNDHLAATLSFYEDLASKAQTYLKSAYPGLDTTMRRKRAREMARCILPNATATTLYASANVRAIRHFLEMRGSEHADREICDLALTLLAIMQREAPLLFGDYQIINGEYGPYITTPYQKV